MDRVDRRHRGHLAGARGVVVRRHDARSGRGPSARLATRIGATLAWYALIGPVINLVADGAVVTRGGIFGVTVAATAAMGLGVLLGLVRWPEYALAALLRGRLGRGTLRSDSHLAAMLVADSVNLEQIRRLDWLIVLSCGILTAIGAHSRPEPASLVRSAKRIRAILISLAGGRGHGEVRFFAVGSIWSPAQAHAVGLRR